MSDGRVRIWEYIRGSGARITAARAEMAALRFQRAGLRLALALKQNFTLSFR
jgi:hypothetical protein